MVEWAQWYAEVMGWPIFPVKRRDKAPYTAHGLLDATTDTAQITAWWEKWRNANIGFALPEGWLVVDVDARKDGVLSLNSLEKSHSMLPRTLTNLTGSGGGSAHYCLHLPPDVLVHGTFPEDYPGLDVRKHGNYIIVPPSIHASGQRYMWESDYGPDDCAPQPAPAWLLALLQQPASHGSNGTGDDGGPIYEGEREATLLSIGGTMLYKKHTAAEIHAHLSEVNTARCIKPLEPKDIDRLVASLFKMEARKPQMIVTEQSIPLGWARPVNQDGAAAPPPPTSSAAWVKDLFIYKGGDLKQNAFNIGQILRHHPYWQMEQRFLWYDVIRGRAMCGQEQISKHLATAATEWFGGEMRLGISNLDLLKTCMEAQAMQTERDLLKEHLAALPEWDGEPRLESWLSDVTEAPDDPYTREISRRLPVSMIARALFPGCQYREVVILEGKENAGKSHLVEALATTEWYVSLSMNMESKDAHIMLHQFWMAELAELDSISRTEDSRMKAFVTMQHDAYVPKYSNVSISIPRRTIFVGTTNDMGAYLKGQTGNSRYLPLWIGKRVDRDALERDRDQIMAESMVHYHLRLADWWAMDATLEKRAQEERENRRERPVYEDPLNDWLEVDRFTATYADNGTPVKFTQGETSWPELARWYLQLESPEKWKDRSLQMQIASTLKSLGWIHETVYRHGHMARIWKKVQA